MLSEPVIHQVVDEAMKSYFDATGKIGLSREGLKEAVEKRGGGTADVNNAMIIGLYKLSPKNTMFIS